jgi:hypothetical protein
MSGQTTIYTIMPDYGCVYAWVREDGREHRGVGGSIADTCGWYGDQPISDGLHQDFARWQSMFESADLRSKTSHLFDWPAFHDEGLRLAHALKAELGDAARVIYEKPYEDSGRDDQERREILANGAVRNLPGRKAIYESCGLSELITEIISGGQTGADRAGLDWAIAHEIPHSGWCPRGRKAEDGEISSTYQLNETESEGYLQRTRRNIENSDGTLILNLGRLDGGSLRTEHLAAKICKPSLTLHLDSGEWAELRDETICWLKLNGISRLNIAGPRESKRPGIYEASRKFLELLNENHERDLK